MMDTVLITLLLLLFFIGAAFAFCLLFAKLDDRWRDEEEKDPKWKFYNSDTL